MFLLGLLNINMRNYTINDWNNFINEYDSHITHVVVAHTNIRAYVDPQNKWVVNDEARIEGLAAKAIKDCRYAMNCFNKLLHYGHGNRVVRQPLLYRPLSFVTLEGAKATTDSRQTLHFNISLGNLPAEFTTADIEMLFKYAWCEKAGLNKNVWVRDYYRQEGKDWHGYTGKEADYDRERVCGENSILVMENCWIPHNALATD